MKDLDFTEQLHDIVSDYFENISEQANDICKKNASQLAKKISEDSPVDTGIYQKGWKSTKAYDNGIDSNYVVYQSRKSSLTHLLEYGHINAAGKRVGKRPHINTNADDYAEKTYNEIEDMIKKL